MGVRVAELVCDGAEEEVGVLGLGEEGEEAAEEAEGVVLGGRGLDDGVAHVEDKGVEAGGRGEGLLEAREEGCRDPGVGGCVRGCDAGVDLGEWGAALEDVHVVVEDEGRLCCARKLVHRCSC